MAPTGQGSVPKRIKDGYPTDIAEAPVSRVSKLEQRRLGIAGERLGRLLGSQRVLRELEKTFRGEPSELPSDAPTHVGEVILRGSDGMYYGVHQGSKWNPDRVKVSIYTPEQISGGGVVGTDLYMTQGKISGEGSDNSGNQTSLTSQEALAALWKGLDAFSEITGKWKMPEQAEPGLDWENLTGIKDALKSGSTVVISRTSLQENDTTIGVRVHSKKIRESVIHGINSYSEGALRDANKKLLIDSSERGTAPLLSDEPPTSESLLSWFMRQGGYIKLSMLPGGTDIVSIGFNLLVDSPLWNALRMSNFSPDINNVFDNSMMEAINSGIRNAREMIRQRHRGSQALDLLELFS